MALSEALLRALKALKDSQDISKALLQAQKALNDLQDVNVHPLHPNEMMNKQDFGIQLEENEAIVEVLKILLRGNVQDLKNSGLNLDVANSAGITALQYCIFEWNNLEYAEKLVLAGADVTHADSTGLTIFERAIRNRNLKAVTLLLKSERCNVHGNGDIKVQAPIFRAIYSGNAAIVDSLLRNGANVNGTWQMKNGNTISVLHAAVDANNVNVMKTVLEGKPLLSVTDSAGLTPLEAAYNKICYTGIMAALKDANSPPAREEFYKKYKDHLIDSLNRRYAAQQRRMQIRRG